MIIIYNLILAENFSKSKILVLNINEECIKIYL